MNGLILTRKIGQSFTVFCGDKEIKVTLEDLKGTRAGILRIQAPRDVEILRDELLEDEDERSRATVDKYKQAAARKADS
jgi:sRNA-binding carbon storage regulator CsrA